MMTPERIAEIKARAEAATPGPWWDEDCVIHCNIHVNKYPHVCSIRSDDKFEYYDADFIAHARQDVPDLCAEVERLNEMVRCLTADLKIWHDVYEGKITIQQLREVERLRAENEELREDAYTLTIDRQERDALRAKLARIREAIYALIKKADMPDIDAGDLYDDIRDLVAAIEEDE